MDDERLYFTASDISISEQKSNDIFLCVEMRMQSTRPNGNNEGVTEGFIDEIVSNPDKYSCLPLYVDINRLRVKDYRSLGHMYNRLTNRFMSTQIGGMRAFRKVSDEYGISLMGEARIPKREVEVCQCVMEQYGMSAQNFSFEIKYARSDTISKDGVTFVDASENNALTGMAIVSIPAYKESKAQSLVAEENVGEMECENNEEAKQLDNYEGVDTMTQEEAIAIIAEKDKAIDEKDQKITDLETKVSVAEKKAEDMEDEKMEKEDEDKIEEFEAAKKKCAEELNAANASIAEKDKVIDEKDQKITDLEAKISELEPMKAAYETMKAESEAAILKDKQNKAKAFAEKQRLDTESKDVADAIASLNYEAIASLAMENEKESNPPVKLASYTMSAGLELKSRYGGLLESR